MGSVADGMTGWLWKVLLFDAAVVVGLLFAGSSGAVVALALVARVALLVLLMVLVVRGWSRRQRDRSPGAEGGTATESPLHWTSPEADIAKLSVLWSLWRTAAVRVGAAARNAVRPSRSGRTGSKES